MKYFSTFSGIGGFELGIQQAYDNRSNLRNGTEVLSEDLPNTEESQDGATCIGYSEIDKYATQIYSKHFPNHKNYGDITKIDATGLPDFDLFVGGFPCQSFSIAGKRAGFADTRGTMFFEIARIVREKQPRLLLLENVKGLLSHDKGRTFYTIISTLDEMGYDCQWQVLNSKNHGVPQNRERVFIIGHLRGTPRPQVFPFVGQGNKNTTLGLSTENTVARTLTAGGNSGGTHSGMTIIQQPFVAMTEKRTAEAKQIRKETKDRDYSPRRGKYLAPRADDRGNCVTAGQGKEHLLSDGSKIRRLTPTECERLQGFPDGWTEGLSDTQRYKTLGNAVTVNVIRDIMEKLL